MLRQALEPKRPPLVHFSAVADNCRQIAAAEGTGELLLAHDVLLLAVGALSEHHLVSEAGGRPSSTSSRARAAAGQEMMLGQ